MTRLYIVRHGESQVNTRPDIVGGRSNHAPLTEKGRRQAKKFGQWLAASDIVPDAIYASPAIRTVDTLDLSLKETDFGRLGYHVEPLIQELAQGVKEGTLRSEAYNDDVKAQIAKQQLDFKFEEGESIAEVMGRMSAFALHIALKHPDQTVLAYGHGFSTRCLAGKILNLSHQEVVFGLGTPNVSLSGFEVTPNTRSVLYVGRRVIDEDNA